ncbi:hypothetical protein K438DRAFT_1764926 [Mycena galopus ATCC 62051]|nr:hypothetical protein K438DRAFT_1764926 [Mycena galopus ATCC 62051]
MPLHWGNYSLSHSGQLLRLEIGYARKGILIGDDSHVKASSCCARHIHQSLLLFLSSSTFRRVFPLSHPAPCGQCWVDNGARHKQKSRGYESCDRLPVAQTSGVAGHLSPESEFREVEFGTRPVEQLQNLSPGSCDALNLSLRRDLQVPTYSLWVT